MKKWLKFISITMTAVVILGLVGVLSVNTRVKAVGKSRLLTVDEASQLTDVDCIIVLGCQVRADGSLSDMLHDRLARGVEIEAYSIEDGGEGVCFHVFVYNHQPGIELDYLTGESWIKE